ncbi:MAG TPA: toll/interleukin-1 receptor domain-containing protein [Saprospiraceae bacterium]|nr:toll/interleukin-1 receptor domain-containing protein [Saprospiraceae bacterium]
MPEVDYNSLLLQYKGGNLIPIIGSDLFKIKSEDGNQLSLEEYLMKSMEKKPIVKPDPLENFTAFTFDHPDLENQVPAIYERLRPDEIDANMITQLSNLQGFKVFITTSCDRNLEELLGENTETLIWNHNTNTPLQFDFTNNKKKLVYLFGRIKKEDEPNSSISFSDVDRLECLYNLSLTNTKSNNKDNYSFLEYLKGKSLLFIGNNFQDWFIRFAIRILCNAPFNNIIRKVYIINDSSRKLNFEEFFFKRFEIQLIHDSPIHKFIDNLCTVINKDEQVKSRFENKQVFISYDRTDAKYADEIYEKLTNFGVNTWLDRNDIKPGEFKKEIKEYIQSTKTAIFISLLSKTLIEKNEEESYVKKNEWKTAKSRYDYNNYLIDTGGSIVKFTILPLAIDDFKLYYQLLPDFIKQNNIYDINQPDLLDFIEELLK